MYTKKKLKNNNRFFGNMKEKKFQSDLFSPLGQWTGNNFLFKGGLSIEKRME